MKLPEWSSLNSDENFKFLFGRHIPSVLQTGSKTSSSHFHMTSTLSRKIKHWILKWRIRARFFDSMLKSYEHEDFWKVWFRLLVRQNEQVECGVLFCTPVGLYGSLPSTIGKFLKSCSYDFTFLVESQAPIFSFKNQSLNFDSKLGSHDYENVIWDSIVCLQLDNGKGCPGNLVWVGIDCLVSGLSQMFLAFQDVRIFI